MARTFVYVAIFVVVLAVPTVATAGTIYMPQVRAIAKKQARHVMLTYDASGYRVTCNQTGRLTAYCRLRLLEATNSDGGNYDCSIFVKYKLHANGYIYSKPAGDFC